VTSSPLSATSSIGTTLSHAAGGDPHRLARRESPLGRPARRDAGDDRQRPRRVGGAKSETVHRRSRERRQVDGRTGVLGEHPAGRILERDRLCVQRLHALEDERERLLDRQQVGRRRHRREP
jgi:hypothetical protein